MVFTFLDTETTGLLLPNERIIEFAAVMFDSATEQPIGKLVRRWNPGVPINAKAEAVHGITLADVAHLPKIEDDLVGTSLIQRIVANTDLFVWHNGRDFDKPFIKQEFMRIGLPIGEMENEVDTMVDARWATAWGKSPTLGELCFACRVPYDTEQAHGGEYDVSVTAQCFFFALKRGFYQLPQSLMEAAI